MYPLLQQEATVGSPWSNQGRNLSFRRPLNDCKIDKLVELFKTLEQFKELSS